MKTALRLYTVERPEPGYFSGKLIDARKKDLQGRTIVSGSTLDSELTVAIPFKPITPEMMLTQTEFEGAVAEARASGYIVPSELVEKMHIDGKLVNSRLRRTREYRVDNLYAAAADSQMNDLLDRNPLLPNALAIMAPIWGILEFSSGMQLYRTNISIESEDFDVPESVRSIASVASSLYMGRFYNPGLRALFCPDKGRYEPMPVENVVNAIKAREARQMLKESQQNSADEVLDIQELVAQYTTAYLNLCLLSTLPFTPFSALFLNAYRGNPYISPRSEPKN